VFLFVFFGPLLLDSGVNPLLFVRGCGADFCACGSVFDDCDKRVGIPTPIPAGGGRASPGGESDLEDRRPYLCERSGHFSAGGPTCPMSSKQLQRGVFGAGNASAKRSEDLPRSRR